MDYVQLFGGLGIGVVIILILYSMYLVFDYLSHEDAGDQITARKLKRRLNKSIMTCCVVLILLLLPTFIWPR